MPNAGIDRMDVMGKNMSSLALFLDLTGNFRGRGLALGASCLDNQVEKRSGKKKKKKTL